MLPYQANNRDYDRQLRKFPNNQQHQQRKQNEAYHVELKKVNWIATVTAYTLLTLSMPKIALSQMILDLQLMKWEYLVVTTILILIRK